MNISDYINGFVALFAISNPIGNLPIYIGLTANRSKKTKTTNHQNRLPCLCDYFNCLMFYGRSDFIGVWH
jgi:small neutral amino acid transporter SnatA (MarC family)